MSLRRKTDVEQGVSAALERKEERINRHLVNLQFKKIPGREIISSYLQTNKFQNEEYRALEDYVIGVRANLVKELDCDITQAQMLVLDSITELLIVLKVISIWIAEDPDRIWQHIPLKGGERLKKGSLSVVLGKDYVVYQNTLDRKLQLFYTLGGMSKRSESRTEGEQVRDALILMDKPKKKFTPEEVMAGKAEPGTDLSEE